MPHYQAQAAAQDESQANYAEKLVKSEGEIDWSQSAAAIEREIRGLTPWPGAYTFLAGQRVKILASLPVNESQKTNEPAGTVISVGRKAVLVACGKEEGKGETLNVQRVPWLLLTCSLQVRSRKPPNKFVRAVSSTMVTSLRRCQNNAHVIPK